MVCILVKFIPVIRNPVIVDEVTARVNGPAVLCNVENWVVVLLFQVGQRVQDAVGSKL